MKNQKLIDFKEVLRRGMIANFENDGHLAPVMFFFKGNRPIISEIPTELLSSTGGKEILADIIKGICKEPDVIAAGIIIEAYGAKLDAESELSKLLMNGAIRVSEMKEKQDIIVMIFSTPEGEECIAYEVNPETKSVGEKFAEDAAKNYGGTFSHFFSWNIN